MQADQIPAEIVEKARRVLMVHGPSQGAEPHPIETDHPETAGWVEGWREAWTAVPDILAAVLPEVQALALQEARHAIRAMTPAPNSRLTWESAQSKAARTLLEMEKALRSPDAGVGGGERG